MLPEIHCGELHICPDGRNVWLERNLPTLTRYEFDLLFLLAQHPGRVFSKEQIYTHVWKEEIRITDNAVQCVISSLKRKMKQPDMEYIQTVWGVGYKFIVPDARVLPGL